MNESELIAKAKRDYIPGTIFISPENGRKYTVLNNSTNHIFSGFDNGLLAITSPGHGEFVYYGDKWAEIISPELQLEESTIINNYPIY